MIATFGKYGVRAQLNPLQVEFRSNLQEPDRWLVEYAGGHPTASGQTMTERTAMQLTAVFACVNLISRAISTAPFCLHQTLPDGTTREATDHPLYRLLRYPPNEEMTKKTFWETFMGHLLLWGNGYAEIERNGAGQPVALWPLRPDRTFPRRLEGRNGKPTGELVYAARSSAGPEVMLPAYNVLHVMSYSYDGLRGLSPIALHRETLGRAMAQGDYGARFFGNNASPGGVLTHPAKMKPESSKRLKESWEESHRGGDQAHRVAVLEEGVKFEKIGMSNEDAQYLLSRTFELSEVARMYNMPLHKIQELTHATFSNIEHLSIEFVRDAVEPWGDGIESEVHRKLLTPIEQQTYFAEHDFTAQKTGDLKSQNEAEEIEWRNGWSNADEIRRRRNRNPLANAEGKVYWVAVTQQPIDRALHPPTPQPAGGSGASGGEKVPPQQGKEPVSPPADEKPAKRLREFADRRRQLTHAYVPLLASVGERLARKEAAALSRSGADPDNFFREHFEYVRDAVKPVLTSIQEAIWTLCEMERFHQVSIAERDKFVEGYAEAFAHRYCKAALVEHIQRPAQWGNGVNNRAHEEAMRAANAFAVHVYKAGGVKRLAWILPEGGCSNSKCLALASRSLDPSGAHPPSDPRCECQIVAADAAVTNA